MIEPHKVAAIYLAAGSSRRFGAADKLSAIYRGKPLAMHGAELISAIPFRQRIAICRSESPLQRYLAALGFTIVTNPAPDLGMGRSLALGVAEASRLDAAAAAVFLADMPDVTLDHVMALLGVHQHDHDIVSSSNGLAPMPPALFGRRRFDELQGLDGDKGARRMLWSAIGVAGSRAMLRDIDTIDDLLGPTPIGGGRIFTDSILDPAGPVALAQRSMLFEAVGLMLIVVAPVFVFTALIVWRYRAGNSAARYLPDWESSRPLEIAIWLVPLAIIVLLWNLVWTRTHQLDPYLPIAAAQPPLLVQAVGLDWQWLFIYPEQNVASLNRLVFPAGRPLTLELTTDTVMNALSIPALGGQIYAMPGMRTELNLLADAPGSFAGRNTQFSGDGFSGQSFPAVAVTDADFETFIAEARRGTAQLDSATYGALARPTETPAPKLFAPVEPDLFASIIARYAAMPHPGMEHGQ